MMIPFLLLTFATSTRELVLKHVQNLGGFVHSHVTLGTRVDGVPGLFASADIGSASTLIQIPKHLWFYLEQPRLNQHIEV
eukprot:UN25040